MVLESDSKEPPADLGSDAQTPLSKVEIKTFTCSHEYVVGSDDVVFTWVCAGAEKVQLESNGLLADGFAAGQYETTVAEDRTFTLTAVGEHGRPSIRRITVRKLSPLAFHLMLWTGLAAIASTWYLAEGILHGVDVVETATILQIARMVSRLVAVGSSILGAPAVLALIGLRVQRSSLLTQAIVRALRSRTICTAICVVNLLPVAFAGYISLASDIRYLSSEIDRPIHVWTCDEDGRVGPQSELRLVIKPGTSSARILSDRKSKCITPEGVRPVNRRIDASGRRDISFDERMTFTCEQWVILDPDCADQCQHYRHRVRWDDNSATPFDLVPHAPPPFGLQNSFTSVQPSSKLLSKRFMKSCTGHSRNARLERERAPGSGGLERLTWNITLDPSGGRDTEVALELLKIPIAGPGKRYMTIGFADTWESTVECKNGSCDLTRPKQKQTFEPNFLCLTPTPPTGTASTESSCAAGQTWSYFQRISTSSGLALGTLVLCLPGEQPGAKLRVESQHATWTGPADPSGITTIPWPSGDLAAAEVTLSITLSESGERKIVPLPNEARPKDGMLAGTTVELRRKATGAAIIGSSRRTRPLRFSSSCSFEPIYTGEAAQQCKLLSGVEVTTSGQFITFAGLPSWAAEPDEVTSWRPSASCLPFLDQPTCKLTFASSSSLGELRCE